MRKSIYLTKEISRLKNKIDKQSIENKKTQYPIPNYFIVDFELVFNIDDNDLNEYEKIIIEKHKKEVTDILNDTLPNGPSNTSLGINSSILPNSNIADCIASLNNQPLISIKFLDKNDNRIIGFHEQVSMSYRNQNAKKSTSFEETYYHLWYNPKKREIVFEANRIEMKTYQNIDYTSLLDIENSKVEFRYFNYFNRNIHTLRSLTLRTPKNRRIRLEEFNKPNKSKNKFETKITKNDMWR